MFQEQALYNDRGVTLGGQAGDPQRVTAMLATPSLLRLLQVQPVRGRIFAEEDGEIGKTHKAVLTYASWQQWFGGRDNAIGQDVRINGEPFIGRRRAAARLRLPRARRHGLAAGRLHRQGEVGRLAPQQQLVVHRAAEARRRRSSRRGSRSTRLNARNLDRFPELKQILINAGFHTVVVPLQAYLVRDLRSTLYLLWGGVIFVLLIGAVNVTNLMLVRSSARMKELATRHALGAGLARIARQLLTESLVLALAGGRARPRARRAPACAPVPLRPRQHAAGHQRRRSTATVVAFTLALALALPASDRA